MEKKRSARALLALVMMVMITITTVFTTPSTYVEAASGSVKSVTVTNLPSNTLTLKKGASKVLKTKVEAAKGKVSQKVTFKSSNTKIVTVNEKGKITANKKKTGSATVTITSVANKKKSFKVKVTVGIPVSKVTLNKKNVSLYIGDKTTLKAKVGPKKASNKNIVWTSSNEKIVKVNSKGQITALAAGKATIAATAKDGSGKRATCKVVVADPVVMETVSVYNEATINVKLSAAQPLTIDNFVVKSKWYENGSYKNTCTIDSVSTTDNINYVISLNYETVLGQNEYVQVTANGLNSTGTQSLETIFVKPVYQNTYDSSRFCKAGEATKYTFHADSDVVGLDVLPAGLTYSIKNNKVEIWGTPTVCGASVTTIVEEDELGDTFTTYIYWFIYDDTNIIGGTTPTYTLTGEFGTATVSKYYDVMGGSGHYEYTLLDGCGYFGFEYNDDGTVKNYEKICGTAPAGGYNVIVQVRDKATGSVTNVTVPIVVGAAVNVTGTIVEGSGAVVTGGTRTCPGYAGYAEAVSVGASVNFYTQDRANKFSYSQPTVKPDGTYSAFIPAGVYDVKVGVSGEYKKYYDVALVANTPGLNLQIPSVYKVTIASDNATYASTTLGWWENEKGETVGYGEVAYLPIGATTLTAENKADLWWDQKEDGSYEQNKWCSIYNGYAEFKSAVAINVTGAMTVVAPVTVVSEPATLALDAPLTIPVGYKGYVKFTAPADGVYYCKGFDQVSCLSTYTDTVTGEINVTSTYIDGDWNNEIYSGGTLWYPITLKAGTTYYIYRNNTYEGAQPIDIFITATQPVADTTY